jgi:hypothetical protein
MQMEEQGQQMKYLLLMLALTGCYSEKQISDARNAAGLPKLSKRYEVWFKDYQGVEQHLKCHGVATQCGVQLSDCDDGYDYDCVHNIKDHEIMEIK